MVIPPLAGYWYFRFYRARRPHLVVGYLPAKKGYFFGKLYILPILQLLTLVAVVISLAGPQRLMGEKESVLAGQRWYAWVDISASMDKPIENTSAAAISWLCFEQLLQKRPTDEVGLGVVGSQPIVISPLTNDHELLKEIFRQVPINQLPRNQSNLSDAILTTVPLLYDSSVAARHSAIVLLTDGASNQGVSLQSLVPICKKNQTSIYIIGIGIDSTKQNIDYQELKKVTNGTNGRFYALNSSEEIISCITNITLALETGRTKQLIPEYLDLATYIIPVAVAGFCAYLVVMLMGWYNPLEF